MLPSEYSSFLFHFRSLSPRSAMLNAISLRASPRLRQKRRLLSMHPLLKQRMAHIHRIPLLHEAELERSSERRGRDIQENRDVYAYQRELYSSIRSYV